MLIIYINMRFSECFPKTSVAKKMKLYRLYIISILQEGHFLNFGAGIFQKEQDFVRIISMYISDGLNNDNN